MPVSTFPVNAVNSNSQPVSVSQVKHISYRNMNAVIRRIIPSGLACLIWPWPILGTEAFYILQRYRYLSFHRVLLETHGF